LTADETTEILGERTARKGNGEPALFIYGVFLNVYDKGGEIVNEQI
jgi:hypothetical protein